MMKRLCLLLLFILLCSGIPAADSPAVPEDRELNSADRAFILKTIGGIWEIEKRVFADGTVLKPPQVRGFLIISAGYWTQIEAQTVEVGNVKPFSGSYFGATDLKRTRSIEKVFLTIKTSTTGAEQGTVQVSTEESAQNTWLILERDAVVQRFDNGGEVRMGDDRFFQKRGDIYTTYWKRIVKPADMYKSEM
jgi:hypothetical protein